MSQTLLPSIPLITIISIAACTDHAGLVGTWRSRALVDEPSIDGEDVMVIRADGTYHIEKSDGRAGDGTYQVHGDTLVTEAQLDTARGHLEETFHLSSAGDLLLSSALVREEVSDNVVGTWHGIDHLDSIADGRATHSGCDTTLTLYEDGTGELVEVPYTLDQSTPTTRTIAWTLDGTVLSYPTPWDGPGWFAQYLVVDGRAMSTTVADRLE